MNIQQILIIDDSESLLTALSETLQVSGYETLSASNGQYGLKLFFDERPALVILDVGMPAMDGWTVASRIREVSETPIIMLTAEDTEEDRLHGFSLGVDDYVTKPFSFPEMVARVAAVLKRVDSVPAEEPALFASGSLIIDLSARRVLRDDEPVNLTPTEYRLLEVLVRNAGRPLSHDFLLNEVWGAGYEGEPEHIKRFVWALRQKLEADPSSPDHLFTERGFGYRFE